MSEYGFYIGSAYGAAAIAIGALILHAVLDYRRQARAVSRLEERARRGASPRV